MKLSEAILLGRMLCKPCRNPNDKENNNGCALTMAALSVGRTALGNAWHAAKYEWKWLESQPPENTPCPRGCGRIFNSPNDPRSSLTWEWAIIHIFDAHVAFDWRPWTLEQLVDYVRSIEPAEESTLPDLPLSEQLRLEEEDAAEEGAAIENSGYRDPAENARFA